jgi:outer membrane protein assembly factor BamD (BamD/ComL family)
MRLMSLLTGLLMIANLAGCKSGSKRDVGSIGDVFGPAGRSALGLKRDQDKKLDPTKATRGEAEYDKAKALFDQGQYAEAEKAFKKVAKKYKDYPVEEDSLFYLGESRSFQEDYPAAEDAYADLLKKYSSTRYVDESTKRLFAIAKTWLNDPKPASEVELVRYEENPNARSIESEAAAAKSFPLKPNLLDRQRPVFDAEGRAIAALRLVWLHDPTGPLADDALMMSATHYIRKQNYQEADRIFAIIREEYPQSQFASHAYILGSHAKLASYQGAAYDGRTLEDARKLTQSTVRLFPEAPQRGKLVAQLNEIKLEAAARDWEKAQFYMRKGKPKSAAIYAQLILESYPDTPYFEQARELLVKIGPQDPSLLLPGITPEQITGTSGNAGGSGSADEPPGQVNQAVGEEPAEPKRKR